MRRSKTSLPQLFDGLLSIGRFCRFFKVPQDVDLAGSLRSIVNPSTPRPEGQGLLRVDPEPRFLTPSLKAGLGAAERVKPAVPVAVIGKPVLSETGLEYFVPGFRP